MLSTSNCLFSAFNLVTFIVYQIQYKVLRYSSLNFRYVNLGDQLTSNLRRLTIFQTNFAHSSLSLFSFILLSVFGFVVVVVLVGIFFQWCPGSFELCAPRYCGTMRTDGSGTRFASIHTEDILFFTFLFGLWWKRAG